MQEKEKVETIRCLLQDLTASNTFFNDEEKGIYFDYDGVIEQLQKAQNIMNESVRCPRPANLPEDMAWSERFYDPDEELNPYVYDGSMSLDDHEKVVTAYQADKLKEPFIMTEKIYWVRRFYEDGRYFESEPLTQEQAEIVVCNELLHRKCNLNDLIGEHEFGYEHFVGAAYKLYVNSFDSIEAFEKYDTGNHIAESCRHDPEIFQKNSSDIVNKAPKKPPKNQSPIMF